MKLFIIILIFVLREVNSQTTSCAENESKLAAVTNLVCNDVTSPITNVQRGKKGPKGSFVVLF